MAQQLYCVQADLSAPTKAFTGIPQAIIDGAISSASSMANDYIERRYDLPLLKYSRSLTQAVADIATYLILKERGFPPGPNGRSQTEEAYRDALGWLEKVSTNKIDPGFVDANGIGQDETATARNVPPRRFAYYRSDVTSADREGVSQSYLFWNGRPRGF